MQDGSIIPKVSPDEFFGAKKSGDAPDYATMARSAASRYGVDPDLFERQMRHESANYDPDVIGGRRKSSAGAKGIAQFMDDTGARYGLKGNDFYDPAKALDAGARHMRDLLDQNDGDYEGALAGYNAGQGRVNDGSYLRIKETRNYIKRIRGFISDELKPKISADEFFANPANVASSDLPEPATPRKSARSYTTDLLGERPKAMPSATVAQANPGFGQGAINRTRLDEDATAAPAPPSRKPASQYTRDLLGERPAAPRRTAQSYTTDLLGERPKAMPSATVAQANPGFGQGAINRTRLDEDATAAPAPPSRKPASQYTRDLLGERPAAPRRTAQSYTTELLGEPPTRQQVQPRTSPSASTLKRGTSPQERAAITVQSQPEPFVSTDITAQETEKYHAGLRSTPFAPADVDALRRRKERENYLAQLQAMDQKELRRYLSEESKTRRIENDELEAAGLSRDWLKTLSLDAAVPLFGMVGSVATGIANLTHDKDVIDTVGGWAQNLDTRLQQQQNLYGEDTLLHKVIQGAFSSLPYFIGGGAGGAGKGIVGILGALQNSGSVYNEAKQRGATDDEARRASIPALGVGALEMYGIGGQLDRLGRRALINRFVQDLLREAGEEATQEMTSQVLNNLIAKGYYDPERDVLAGVPEAGLVAAITGGVFGAGGNLAARAIQGRSAQPESSSRIQATPPIGAETEQASAPLVEPLRPRARVPLGQSPDPARVTEDVIEHVATLTGAVPTAAESFVTGNAATAQPPIAPDIPPDRKTSALPAGEAVDPALEFENLIRGERAPVEMPSRTEPTYTGDKQLREYREKEGIEALDERRPEVISPESPSSLPDWVSSNINALTVAAEQSGVADQIEELSAQRLTAKEAATQLGVDVDTVRAVRAKRGIPSMDDKTEFERWIESRKPKADQKEPKLTPEKSNLDEAEAEVILPPKSIQETNQGYIEGFKPASKELTESVRQSVVDKFGGETFDFINNDGELIRAQYQGVFESGYGVPNVVLKNAETGDLSYYRVEEFDDFLEHGEKARAYEALKTSRQTEDDLRNIGATDAANRMRARFNRNLAKAAPIEVEARAVDEPKALPPAVDDSADQRTERLTDEFYHKKFGELGERARKVQTGVFQAEEKTIKPAIDEYLGGIKREGKFIGKEEDAALRKSLHEKYPLLKELGMDFSSGGLSLANGLPVVSAGHLSDDAEAFLESHFQKKYGITDAIYRNTLVKMKGSLVDLRNYLREGGEEPSSPHHSVSQSRRARNTATGKRGQFKKGKTEQVEAGQPSSASKEAWEMTREEVAKWYESKRPVILEGKSEFAVLPDGVKVYSDRNYGSMAAVHPDGRKYEFGRGSQQSASTELQQLRKDGFNSRYNKIQGREEDHRNAIRQALAEGKPVPASVLADYPDLQPKTKVNESVPLRSRDDLKSALAAAQPSLSPEQVEAHAAIADATLRTIAKNHGMTVEDAYGLLQVRGSKEGDVGKGSLYQRPPEYVPKSPKDDSYEEQSFAWLGGKGRRYQDDVKWLRESGRNQEADELETRMLNVEPMFRRLWFHGGSYKGGTWREGAWFAQNKEGAGINFETGRSENITPAYLAIDKALEVDGEFYRVLPEMAAQAKKQGYQAIVGDNQANGMSVYILDPSVIHSVPRDEILSQGKLGATEFLKDGKAIIHLFEFANTSTFLHEMSHFGRRYLSAADQAIAARWAGVKDGKWTRHAEERFARAFERYLRDGKTAAKEMQPVFEKIKAWMREVYKAIKGSPIDVKVSPEIRGVFDRMLGAEPEAKAKAKPTLTGEEDIIQAIRKLGGINMGSLTGEKRWMREGRLRQPGVMTNSGRSVDRMVDALRDEGYHHFEDINGLLDVLHRAAKGETFYGNAKDFDSIIEEEMAALYGEADEDMRPVIASFDEAMKDAEFRDLYATIALQEDVSDEQLEQFVKEAKYVYDLPEDLIDTILEQAEIDRQRLGALPERDTSDTEAASETPADQLDLRTPEEKKYFATYGEDLTIVERAREAGLSTEQFSRVFSVFETLKRQAQESGQSVSAAVEDYIKQGSLFAESELNNKQAALLERLAGRKRKAADKSEQGSMFDTSPTVESRKEKQAAESGDLPPFTLFQSDINPDDHFNFSRSELSTETEAALRERIREAVAEVGTEHKRRVSQAEYRQRAADLDPALVDELRDFRAGQPPPSREVFLAGTELAQSLNREAVSIRKQLQNPNLTDAEQFRLNERAEMLERDARQLIGGLIGVRSEYGRNLALLATVKSETRSLESHLTRARRAAQRKGENIASTEWQAQEKKIQRLTNEIAAAETRIQELDAEIKQMQSKKGSQKPEAGSRKKGVDALFLARLDALEQNALAALGESQSPRVLFQGSDDTAALAAIYAAKIARKEGSLAGIDKAMSDRFGDLFSENKSLIQHEADRLLRDTKQAAIRESLGDTDKEARMSARQELSKELTKARKHARDARLAAERIERETARERLKSARITERMEAKERAQQEREKLKTWRLLASEAQEQENRGYREAIKRRNRWDYDLQQSATVAESRLQDADYAASKEATDDLAMVMAATGAKENATAQNVIRRMNVYGEVFTKREQAIRDRAAEVTNEARAAHRRRKLERDATKGEGEFFTDTQMSEAVREYNRAQEVKREAQRELARLFAVIEKPSVFDRGWDVLAANKSIVFSIDASFGLRQGMGLIGEPRAFIKSWAQGIKTLVENPFSRHAGTDYKELVREIEESEMYPLLKRAGLYYNFDAFKPGADPAQRSDYYQSKIAERIPGIARSERSFAANGDTLRHMVGAKYFQNLIEAGYDPETQFKVFQDMALAINRLTMRGELGKLQAMSKPLNALLSSPRALASRYQIVNMLFDPSVARPVKKFAAKKLGQQMAVYGAVAYLASLAGAEVLWWPPDDSDWMKIRVGNTRYDLSAGWLPIVRMVYKVFTDPKNAGESFESFMANKRAPMATTIWNAFKGEDGVGKPFGVEEALVAQIPLSLQEPIEQFRREGFLGVAKTFPLSFFGVGVQSYGSVGEGAAEYDRIQKLKNRFLHPNSTPKSETDDAAKKTERLIISSLKENRLKAAQKLLSKLKEESGKPEDFEAALSRLDPFYGLTDEKKRQQFLDSLSTKERAKVDKANEFYGRLLQIAATNDLSPAELLPKPIPKEAREPLEREVRRLGLRLPFASNEFDIKGKKSEMSAEDFARYQQEAAEAVYERGQAMIESAAYRDLPEEKKRKMLDAWLKDVSGNRRLDERGKIILEGQYPRSLQREARRTVAGNRKRLRDEERPDRFVRDQLLKERKANR